MIPFSSNSPDRKAFRPEQGKTTTPCHAPKLGIGLFDVSYCVVSADIPEARDRDSEESSKRAPRNSVRACGLLLVLAILTTMGASVRPSAPLANGLGSAKPTLVEGKFAVPTDPDAVTLAWVSRGFSRPVVKVYPRGWERAEHAYSRSLIMTPVTGRMEFVIADQRVVIGPGDELYYPARAVMLSRNLHDGDSTVLVSERRWP